MILRQRLGVKMHVARLGLIAAVVIVTVAPLQAAFAIPGGLQWKKANIPTKSVNQPWKLTTSSYDGSKLVAATGGYIYISSDSGATWTRPATTQFSWKAIAASSDGTKLIAAGQNSGGQGALFTSTDGGATWTERTSAGHLNFQAVASSADGTKLVASVWAGYIYTSTDSGTTWTQQTASGSRNWRTLTSSADGTKIAAAVAPGEVYTSSDSGVTWTQATSTGGVYFFSITMSADGTKIAAAVGGVGYSGYIYTSTDGGTTWTTQTALGSQSWSSITYNPNGTKLIATTNNGGSGSIYTSVDNGATWTQQTGAGLNYWIDTAQSQDGSRLLAAAYNGPLYTSSDGGITWSSAIAVPVATDNWQATASSADGTKVIGAVNGGFIYTSTDSGATWGQQKAAGARAWNAVASSADGTKLVAGEWNGGMYRSTDSGATWTQLNAAGNKKWASIASSGDGTKILAGESSGTLDLSTDSGTTWNPVPGLNSTGGWYELAMTPNGQTIIAADTYGPSSSGGNTYITKDGGATWNQVTALGQRYWNDAYANGAAISSDGQTILLSDPYGADWNSWNGGYIYKSTDGGSTWQPQTSAGALDWAGVAISADATQQVAAVNGGSILTSSDSGATWAVQTDAGTRNWVSVNSSADGTKAVAAVNGDNVYLGATPAPTTTTIDFSTLPAAQNLATTDTLLHAILSATSSTCFTIVPGAVSTLAPTNLKAPEAGVTLLGGAAFNITCIASGGTVATSITLGTTYNDVTQLRAYKGTGTTLTDITRQVSFADQGGKTVVNYTLTDGGAWDEDGATNSQITDPIYIGLASAPAPNGTSTTVPSLASTGTNMYPILVSATAIVIVAGGVLAVTYRRGTSLRK